MDGGSCAADGADERGGGCGRLDFAVAQMQQAIMKKMLSVHTDLAYATTTSSAGTCGNEAGAFACILAHSLGGCRCALEKLIGQGGNVRNASSRLYGDWKL